MNTNDFNASIYSQNLNKPNSYKYVYNIANGYNVLSTIIDAWNQKSIEANMGIYQTGNNKYEFALEDVDWVVELITGVSASGSNLVVTYSGTNDFFRNKITVTDDSFGGVQGRVISHGAGTVTIEPVNVTLNSATQFQAGMYIREFSVSAGFRASRGLESLYTVPFKDYDYAQLFRESCFLARTDDQSTYVEYEGKFWAHRQVDKAIERVAIDRERQSILGDRAVAQSSLDGTNYYTAGLKWAAQNRGGQYVPVTSNMPFATFNNILYNQSIKRASSNGQNKIILAGKAWMFNFQQNYVNNFVQYAGTRNTFGGEAVKGLSVSMYSIGGEIYDIVQLPMFDDPNWSNVPTTIAGLNGSRLSNSFFVIDPNMIPAVGGGLTRPPVQKIYWKNKGMNAKVIGGMVGVDMNPSTGLPSQGMFQNTNSDIDGMQVEVMEHTGNHIPSGKGITFCEVVI